MKLLFRFSLNIKVNLRPVNEEEPRLALPQTLPMIKREHGPKKSHSRPISHRKGLRNSNGDDRKKVS